MKRVLIITYYWPPSGGGGVQRWLKFVKYLRSFDWEPVIYTPLNPEIPETDMSLLAEIPENLEILKHKIWEPYRLYKYFTGKSPDDKIQTAFLSEKKKPNLSEKISVWIRGNFFIPDARKFWIKPSVRFLTKWLEHNHVDAIISTGPPHSMHLIAMKLRDELRIPWLADFRDPWTNIDFYSELKLSHKADNLQHKLEKEVLLKADAVTVVSRGMLLEFEQIIERPIKVITNGFDEDDMKNTEGIIPDKKFSIAHIGSLVKTRNPVVLWEVLSRLIVEKPGFSDVLEIKLVGKIDFEVRTSLEKLGLINYVREIEYLPHNEVIKEQLRSRVLLLLINNTPNATLILTGKVFEYLQSKRPILCIGPMDGDAVQLIQETNSGLCSSFTDAISLKNNILKLFAMYKETTLEMDSIKTEQYSRRNLSRKLAGELNRIVNLSEFGQQNS
ncbi:MAG: glycosyltransferase [Bacteroidales bacterium]|nr:glycosyltransferase [Bacteroidales bacterium]